MHFSKLPSWDDIPNVPGMPHGCAWGLFDQNGERDQLGTLNLITPETILKAKGEIEYGDSVSLDWFLNHVQDPAAERKPFEHQIRSLKHLGYTAYDDEIKINTQSSSQWDGFRHWAHQQTGLHYNNMTHDEVLDPHNYDNSIHYWRSRGGIIGRGVLIDYHHWATAKGLDHPVFERTIISTKQIEEIAWDQGVELRPADILIIRTGWTDMYNQATDAQRSEGTTGDKHIGLEGSEQTVKWLWDKHFTAVASDTLAFEAWPTRPPFSLHDWLIALWGCPVGELWDLESLAAKCRLYKKWSFFISSAPLNVIGGVASPPNIIAIL